MLLKSRKDHDADDIFRPVDAIKPKTQITSMLPAVTPSSKVFNDYNWDVVDEYDPLWPNEYEKLIVEKRDKELEKQRERNALNRDDRNNKRKNSRFNENDSPPATPQATKNKFSGFGGRPDDEDAYDRSPPTATRTGGAAIAPPLSLQESIPIITPFAHDGKAIGMSANVTVPYGSSSVAAKIMAKYGFKVYALNVYLYIWNLQISLAFP